MSGFPHKQCFYPASESAHIFSLPAETLLHILSYISTPDLIACVHTCRYWQDIIEGSETLWKLQCLTLKESVEHIEEDRCRGLTWKETFRQNYGSNGIKRLWRQGTFSNPRSYKDFPANPFCILDAQSWGDIFQEELQRS